MRPITFNPYTFSIDVEKAGLQTQAEAERYFSLQDGDCTKDYPIGVVVKLHYGTPQSCSFFSYATNQEGYDRLLACCKKGQTTQL